MDDIDSINFEIENLKKVMTVLFMTANEELRNELLDELTDLVKRRDKLVADRDRE